MSSPSPPSPPIPVIVEDIDNHPVLPIHSIPCQILTEDGTREARVKNCFETTITNEKQEGVACMSASFRGRPLQGITHDLPQDYTGVVLSSGSSETDCKEMRVKSVFSSLNEWSLDSVPSADEGISSALKWIDIANAIHSDVASSFTDDGPSQ
ncbi:PREDICTED: ribonuclease H2 subunit C-like [Amphimedon queenslandica]|uniref:Uncharacterized protein n=1 Tax=Amphimedon queenslandica TaxID=400682 RepID=A0A1X7VQJ7_AMPQE|nr:PREDICTED: ribonuclease H2 subunit C-like [Amphimedon queenslandica]|eukprot:XP_019861421.1 PREDICTED: ribonuclease H2 subunit C-like [Amphimedon queenslandica]